jgi:hypothetical protein
MTSATIRVKAEIEATNIQISNLEHLVNNGYWSEETASKHKEILQKLQTAYRYRSELNTTLSVLQKLDIK